MHLDSFAPVMGAAFVAVLFLAIARATRGSTLSKLLVALTCVACVAAAVGFYVIEKDHDKRDATIERKLDEAGIDVLEYVDDGNRVKVRRNDGCTAVFDINPSWEDVGAWPLDMSSGRYGGETCRGSFSPKN